MSSIKMRFIFVFITFIILVIFIIMCIIPEKEYELDALEINFLSDNQELVVSNSLPMTDEVGILIDNNNSIDGTTGYVEFEIKSNVEEKVKYELYLTKDTYDLEVPVKFVKVYLTDENDKEFEYFDKSMVPTFYDLRLASTNAGGKLIYSGYLKNNGSQKFKLRMWVADTYELTAEEIKFSANLNVGIK